MDTPSEQLRACAELTTRVDARLLRANQNCSSSALSMLLLDLITQNAQLDARLRAVAAAAENDASLLEEK